MEAQADLKSVLVYEALVLCLRSTEGHIKALLYSATVIVQHHIAVRGNIV